MRFGTFFFLSLQLTGETVGEVKAVADMHQRKAEMAKHSDAFIALPGSYYQISKMLNHHTFFSHLIVCPYPYFINAKWDFEFSLKRMNKY